MNESPQEPGQTGPEAPAPEAAVPARPRGRKRRAIKRGSRWLSIAIIAIVSSIVVTFFTVDIGRVTIGGAALKSLAEKSGSRFLERPLHIGRIVAYVTPGKFAFEDVWIEGPTPDARPFFSAKKIDVDVPWLTIFRKELYIDIRMTGWRMVVEKWPDGKAHLPKLTSKDSGGGGFPLKIRGLYVGGNGGEFIYDDHVTPWSVIAPNLQFDLVRTNALNTYVGAAKFTKGRVQIQRFEPMAADFSTRFQVDGGIVRLKHIDLLTDGAESHISGYVNFKNWPEQEYDIQSTVDFNRMRELFFSQATWRLSGAGRFNGVFKIFRDGFDLSGLFKSDEAGLGWRKSEWRFQNLTGGLQWTPNRFIVHRADSDFLGGRLQLAYGLDPIGRPGGATATLVADYAGVDLYRFTRQFGWTALEPHGSMRGHVGMAWHNGQLDETMEGSGHTTITPPAGQAVASPVLPASADPIPAESSFQKYRPFGEFPLAGVTEYHFSGSTLDFDRSWVATPTTFVRFEGHARGGDANLPFHVTSHDWQNSDRLFAAIMTNFSRSTGAIPVGGRGTFDGVFTKAFNAPRIEGRFAGDNMRAWGVLWGSASGDIAIENSYLDLVGGRILRPAGGSVITSGRYALGYPRADGNTEIDARISAHDMPLEPLKKAFGLQEWPVDGVLESAELALRGGYERPGGAGTMRIVNGTAWKEPFASASAQLAFEGDGSLSLQRVVVTKGQGIVTGNAWLSWAGNAFSVSADSEGLPLDELTIAKFERAPLSGTLRDFSARGSGSFDLPTWEIKGVVPDLYIADEGIGALRGRMTLSKNVVTIDEISARSDRLQVSCRGTIELNATYDAATNCQFEQTSLDPYFKFVGRDLPFNQVVASGSFGVNGPLKDTTRLDVAARIDDASLSLSGYGLKNDGPVQLAFRKNTFQLERVQFTGVDTPRLVLSGGANVTARSFDITANGQASLAVLQAFYPMLTASGSAVLGARLRGTFDEPLLTGRADIADGNLGHSALPHSLRDINGPITFAAGEISVATVDERGRRVDGLQATLGEGPVTFTGRIVLDGYRPDRFELHADGDSLHLRYPEGLQSTVIVKLDLLGPVKSPTLSGTVDVLRASYTLRFQPERGYFSLLSGAVDSGGGLQGAVEDTPPPFPMALDIKIHAPIMPFVENKASNALISGSADVDVSGTIDRPIITGRVVVDRGEWIFSGNRYKVQSASIDFTNPNKFDPFFELSAETRVPTPGQTYQVNLRLTGTLDKLRFNLTSEPWLPEFQILSLILGETPDVGAAELRAQGSPQELQAKALSTAGVAILTSPVTATVGNVVQKATTLTAQIVPILGTQENLQQLNPTARIILGKRISERVYLTYARTLSGAQNEVILVEFDQNDRVSWVLSRNEDRSFALDFRLRYTYR